MAQNSDLISFVDAVIFYGHSTTTMTDISGSTNSLQVNGGKRFVGKFFTAEGDAPVVRIGKRDSLQIVCKVGYDPKGTGPYNDIHADYLAKTAMYLKWYPAGQTTGNAYYTTDKGYISDVAPLYPSGTEDNANILDITFTMEVTDVTPATV